MKSGAIPESGQKRGGGKTQTTFASGLKGGFLTKPQAKPAKAEPAKAEAEPRPAPQPGAAAVTAAAVAVAAADADAEGPAPGAMPVPAAAAVAMPVAPMPQVRAQVVEAEIGDTEEDQPPPNAADGACVRVRISKALLKALWASLTKLKKFVPSHNLETAVRLLVGIGVAKRRSSATRLSAGRAPAAVPAWILQRKS